MKIAFLGKGGSGKSTLATALVKKLHAQNFHILAIDADHNMDLSYNLGVTPSVFLGSDPEYIKEFVGIDRADTYSNALKYAKEKEVRFSISPVDTYTQHISINIDETLRLITTGPHTDRIRSQEYCSHSLAAPLKVYLPLLTLDENEVVVIDERAGTDPVATGILSGVDLAIIVREPTVNSTRVAEQITHELALAGIPHLVVDNKKDGIEIDSNRVTERILTEYLSHVVR